MNTLKIIRFVALPIPAQGKRKLPGNVRFVKQYRECTVLQTYASQSAQPSTTGQSLGKIGETPLRLKACLQEHQKPNMNQLRRNLNYFKVSVISNQSNKRANNKLIAQRTASNSNETSFKEVMGSCLAGFEIRRGGVVVVGGGESSVVFSWWWVVGSAAGGGAEGR